MTAEATGCFCIGQALWKWWTAVPIPEASDKQEKLSIPILPILPRQACLLCWSCNESVSQNEEDNECRVTVDACRILFAARQLTCRKSNKLFHFFQSCPGRFPAQHLKRTVRSTHLT
eukprot:symbB.v1.2.031102.t1/scaffold3573.1/size55725/7